MSNSIVMIKTRKEEYLSLITNIKKALDMATMLGDMLKEGGPSVFPGPIEDLMFFKVLDTAVIKLEEAKQKLHDSSMLVENVDDLP